MSETETGNPEFAELSHEERQSVLFAQLVIQQSNMAMMLLGKSPHPAGGGGEIDLEAAKLFIDQLEMLGLKTKGNLNPAEEALLKQSLTALRLAFVAAVEAKPAEPGAPAATRETASPAAGNTAAPEASPGAAGEEESRKRFSKKY